MPFIIKLVHRQSVAGIHNNDALAMLALLTPQCWCRLLANARANARARRLLGAGQGGAQDVHVSLAVRSLDAHCYICLTLSCKHHYFATEAGIGMHIVARHRRDVRLEDRRLKETRVAKSPTCVLQSTRRSRWQHAPTTRRVAIISPRHSRPWPCRNILRVR